MRFEEEIENIEQTLKFSGLWMTSGSSCLQEHMIRDLAILFLLANVASVYASRASDTLAMSVFYLSICGLVTVQAQLVLSKQAVMEQILSLLSQIFSSREEPRMKTIIIRDAVLAKKFSFCFKSLANSICCLYSYLPLLIDFKLMVSGQKEPFRVPLPFSALLGPSPKRCLYYYSVTLCSIAYMHLVVLYCVPIQSLFCELLVYITAEMKIVKKQIHDMLPTINSQYKGMNLRKTIYFHTRIIRFCSLLKEYYGLIFAVQNIVSSISICFSFYGSFVFWKKGNVFIALLNFSTGLAYLSLMYIVCFLGQYLETNSSELFDAFYETRWYQADPYVRKHLIMTLCQARRPINIHYRRITTLNAALFTQILNKSYTYFMLLKSFG